MIIIPRIERGINMEKEILPTGLPVYAESAIEQYPVLCIML